MATIDIRAEIDKIDVIQFADDTGYEEIAYKMELLPSDNHISITSYDTERMYIKIQLCDVDNFIHALKKAKELLKND